MGGLAKKVLSGDEECLNKYRGRCFNCYHHRVPAASLSLKDYNLICEFPPPGFQIRGVTGLEGLPEQSKGTDANAANLTSS